LEEWSVARQHARILVQHLEMHATPDWRFRDRAMAENVEWILQHEGPDAKAVLWAHNSHVASNPAQQSMGYHLRQALGHRLAIFGFAFNRGGFVALDSLLQRRAFEVGPAADSSVDGVLAAAGLSLAAVDLRAAPNGPVAEWFAQPHWHQSIGWGYEESPGSRYVFRAMASMLYDVLLFVDSTSAAHTRKNHAPSWQAPLPGPANLDFEDRAADGRPLQWHVAPAPSTEELGFTVVATDERQFRGKRSVMIARVPAHHYGDSFAGLDQVVDATPYRGKWVRLKAMSRAEVRGEESRAHLWLRLRIDNEYSGGDVLRDQTITGRNWSPYEVVVFIPENVATLQFGFALVGDGRAWIADVSLEVVPKPSE
jgi:erythromycin esterase